MPALWWVLGKDMAPCSLWSSLRKQINAQIVLSSTKKNNFYEKKWQFIWDLQDEESSKQRVRQMVFQKVGMVSAKALR